MLSGLSILCFAACYAAALILEIARPVWPAPARRALEIGFVTAGLFAHTWYLAARAVAAEASPLSSPHDWYLLAAWALAAVYFYLEAYYPQASVGLFVLPLMLGLIGAAHFADRAPFAVVRASRFWGNVHGASLLLGTVTVMAGFVAGLMYLVQSYRLKHKMLSPRFRLPSLEWLERVNSRAILTSVLFIGVGFLSGVVLNRVEQRSHLTEIPWYDPVILSLAGMLLWLLAAAAFNLLYRAARRGRKVAYLTVASFGFLVIVLGVLLFVNTEHGAREKLSAIGCRPSAKQVAARTWAPDHQAGRGNWKFPIVNFKFLPADSRQPIADSPFPRGGA